MPESVPYYLTEAFCREHGHKGAAQLARDFTDCTPSSWRDRRSNMRIAFPNLVALIDRLGRPVAQAEAVPDLVPGAMSRDQALLSAHLLPEQDMIARLKSGGTVVDLANHFDCAPSRVEATIAHLREKHLLVTETAAGFVLDKEMRPVTEPFRIDTAQFEEREFGFGWGADFHIGSKYERQDVLEDLADRWAAAGIGRVLVGGNWIDGSGRKFNEHDIYVHGVDNQVANFLEKLPRRPGMEWDILSGDDHEGWFVQDCSVNIGHVLESEAHTVGREDIHDLGYMERDIELEAAYGSARVRVIHAGGGSSYATSYTSQKYVESLQGGEKPQAVFVGHFHKFDWCDPREVDVIQMMTTQDQTPFMRKRRLQAHVGGGIAWFKQNELGILTSCKVEKWHYFDRKFYAFKWKRPEPSTCAGASNGGRP